MKSTLLDSSSSNDPNSEPRAHTHPYLTHHGSSPVHTGSDRTLFPLSSDTEQATVSTGNGSRATFPGAPVRCTSALPASASKMATFSGECADAVNVIQHDAPTPAERSFMRLHGCRRHHRRFARSADANGCSAASDRSMSFVTTSTLHSMPLESMVSRAQTAAAAAAISSSIVTPVNATMTAFSPDASSCLNTSGFLAHIQKDQCCSSHPRPPPPPPPPQEQQPHEDVSASHRGAKSILFLSPCEGGGVGVKNRQARGTQSDLSPVPWHFSSLDVSHTARSVSTHPVADRMGVSTSSRVTDSMTVCGPAATHPGAEEEEEEERPTEATQNPSPRHGRMENVYHPSASAAPCPAQSSPPALTATHGGTHAPDSHGAEVGFEMFQASVLSDGHDSHPLRNGTIPISLTPSLNTWCFPYLGKWAEPSMPALPEHHGPATPVSIVVRDATPHTAPARGSRHDGSVDAVGARGMPSRPCTDGTTSRASTHRRDDALARAGGGGEGGGVVHFALVPARLCDDEGGVGGTPPSASGATGGRVDADDARDMLGDGREGEGVRHRATAGPRAGPRMGYDYVGIMKTTPTFHAMAPDRPAATAASTRYARCPKCVATRETNTLTNTPDDGSATEPTSRAGGADIVPHAPPAMCSRVCNASGARHIADTAEAPRPPDSPRDRGAESRGVGHPRGCGTSRAVTGWTMRAGDTVVAHRTGEVSHHTGHDAASHRPAQDKTNHHPTNSRSSSSTYRYDGNNFYANSSSNNNRGMMNDANNTCSCLEATITFDDEEFYGRTLEAVCAGYVRRWCSRHAWMRSSRANHSPRHTGAGAGTARSVPCVWREEEEEQEEEEEEEEEEGAVALSLTPGHHDSHGGSVPDSKQEMVGGSPCGGDALECGRVNPARVPHAEALPEDGSAPQPIDARDGEEEEGADTGLLPGPSSRANAAEGSPAAAVSQALLAVAHHTTPDVPLPTTQAAPKRPGFSESTRRRSTLMHTPRSERGGLALSFSDVAMPRARMYSSFASLSPLSRSTEYYSFGAHPHDHTCSNITKRVALPVRPCGLSNYLLSSRTSLTWPNSGHAGDACAKGGEASVQHNKTNNAMHTHHHVHGGHATHHGQAMIKDSLNSPHSFSMSTNMHDGSHPTSVAGATHEAHDENGDENELPRQEEEQEEEKEGNARCVTVDARTAVITVTALTEATAEMSGRNSPQVSSHFRAHTVQFAPLTSKHQLAPIVVQRIKERPLIQTTLFVRQTMTRHRNRVVDGARARAWQNKPSSRGFLPTNDAHELQDGKEQHTQQEGRHQPQQCLPCCSSGTHGLPSHAHMASFLQASLSYPHTPAEYSEIDISPTQRPRMFTGYRDPSTTTTTTTTTTAVAATTRSSGDDDLLATKSMHTAIPPAAMTSSAADVAHGEAGCVGASAVPSVGAVNYDLGGDAAAAAVSSVAADVSAHAEAADNTTMSAASASVLRSLRTASHDARLGAAHTQVPCLDDVRPTVTDLDDGELTLSSPRYVLPIDPAALLHLIGGNAEGGEGEADGGAACEETAYVLPPPPPSAVPRYSDVLVTHITHQDSSDGEDGRVHRASAEDCVAGPSTEEHPNAAPHTRRTPPTATESAVGTHRAVSVHDSSPGNRDDTSMDKPLQRHSDTGATVVDVSCTDTQREGAKNVMLLCRTTNPMIHTDPSTAATAKSSDSVAYTASHTMTMSSGAAATSAASSSSFSTRSPCTTIATTEESRSAGGVSFIAEEQEGTAPGTADAETDAAAASLLPHPTPLPLLMTAGTTTLSSVASATSFSSNFLPPHFRRTLTNDTRLIRHIHSIDNMEREVDNETGDLVVSVGMRLIGWLEVVGLLGSGSFGQVFLCKDLRICDGHFVHPSEIDGEDFAYWNCSHSYLPYGDCNAVPTHAPLVAVKVVKSIPLFESQSVLEAEMLVLIGAQVDKRAMSTAHGDERGTQQHSHRTRNSVQISEGSLGDGTPVRRRSYVHAEASCEETCSLATQHGHPCYDGCSDEKCAAAVGETEREEKASAAGGGGREIISATDFSTYPPPLDPRSRYVAKVLADGICYGHHCIVLERYGANLYEYIESNHYRGLPMYQIRSIGFQLLSALSLLHEDCHIIHADIKPENMLFTLDSCRNRLMTSIASSNNNPTNHHHKSNNNNNSSNSNHIISKSNAYNKSNCEAIEGNTNTSALNASCLGNPSTMAASSALLECSFIKHMNARVRGMIDSSGNNYVVVEGGGATAAGEELASMSSLRRRSFVNLTTSASFAAPEPVRVQALTQPTLVSRLHGMTSHAADVMPAGSEKSLSSVVLGKTARRRSYSSSATLNTSEAYSNNNTSSSNHNSNGKAQSHLSPCDLQCRRSASDNLLARPETVRSHSAGYCTPAPVSDLRIKLIDFSSSCYTDQKCYSYIQSRYYRAPEVIVGAPYDEKIDLWSTGCVLAELLLGMPLLAGCNEHHQLSLIEGMIGKLPVSMLTQGSNTSWYYHYCNDPCASAVASSRGVTEPTEHHAVIGRGDDAAAAGEAASGMDGRPESTPKTLSGRYTLLSREDYFAQQQKEPQAYTRLFTYDTLHTLIRHCPLSVEERNMSRGMNPYAETAAVSYGDSATEESMAMGAAKSAAKEEMMASIRSELIHQRFLFFDLLCGLLQTDPAKRLTATEALQHPFFAKSLSYVRRFHLDA